MLPWIRLQSKKVNKAATFLTVILFVAVLFFFCAPHVLAAPGDTFGVDQVGQGIGLGDEDIRVIIARIIRVVLGLLGIIVVCIVLYAGFMIMTAGGDEERIAVGKKTLINAVIGLAIILSAFAIVQFVLNSLIGATGLFGGLGSGGTGNAPSEQTFSGSGSLGTVIRDHYPFVNQKEVPRNTKISVTFAEPINPGSLISNTNQTCWPKEGVAPISMQNPDACLHNAQGQIVEYFGDCVRPPAGVKLDPRIMCDSLLADSASIARVNESDTVAVAAAAMTAYSADNEASSFVFWPLEPLGDDTKPITYRVTLTNKIKRADGAGIFDRRNGRPYLWQFETGTSFDVLPPHVATVVPGHTSSAPRNTVLQVNFSEAMDPTSVQGAVGNNGSFTNIIFNKTTVKGEWRVSNGFKTTEFISAEACGQNSCGDKMYCLPVVCDAGETGVCTDTYETLLRSAQLDGTGGFQAIPFTGLTDMAGNALDGDNNGTPEGQPLHNGDRHIIQPADKQHDNFVWSYIVRDEIDRSAPLIEQVTPGVDKQDVAKDEPIKIMFSKSMLGYTLGDITLEEYRQGANNEQPWYQRRFETLNGKTVAYIDQHDEFGRNHTDYYYFVSVPSTVKSLTQNCLYPGRGPKGVGDCTEDNLQNCVPVNYVNTTDTGCAAGLSSVDKNAQATINTCLDTMRAESLNAAP